jgi:hypothetical protein
MFSKKTAQLVRPQVANYSANPEAEQDKEHGQSDHLTEKKAK